MRRKHKEALLVRPDFPYNPNYPPFGLMRISTWLKSIGYTTEYVRGTQIPQKVDNPSEIYVTSMFTWGWKKVWDSVKFYKALYPDAKLTLGGIYASGAPEHAKLSGADIVVVGLMHEAEKYGLDYSLVKSPFSYVWTCRGCTRNCGFCVVKYVEGPKLTYVKESIKDDIIEHKSKIMVMDNNFLLNPNHLRILDELIASKKEVVFPNGLDARLITTEVFEKLIESRISNIVIAFDSLLAKEACIRVLDIRDRISPNRAVEVYMLYNWAEPPEELWDRLKTINTRKKTSIFLLKYRPFSLEEHNYISPNWDKYMLRGLRTIINEANRNGLVVSVPLYQFEHRYGRTPDEFVEKITKLGKKWYYNNEKGVKQ